MEVFGRRPSNTRQAMANPPWNISWVENPTRIVSCDLTALITTKISGGHQRQTADLARLSHAAIWQNASFLWPILTGYLKANTQFRAATGVCFELLQVAATTTWWTVSMPWHNMHGSINFLCAVETWRGGVAVCNQVEEICVGSNCTETSLQMLTAAVWSHLHLPSCGKSSAVPIHSAIIINNNIYT